MNLNICLGTMIPKSFLLTWKRERREEIPVIYLLMVAVLILSACGPAVKERPPMKETLNSLATESPSVPTNTYHRQLCLRAK